MKSCGERKPYTIPLPAVLTNYINDKSVRTVLELGCGYGRACFFLHEHNLMVVGADLDRVQLELALKEKKSRKIHEGIDFVISDARRSSFPDSSFDVVTMLGLLTLTSKADRPKIIDEVSRVVKPLGYVFVEEFGRTWENPVYRKRYKDDLEVTGELGTVALRDEAGRILHFGHHFTREELFKLLRRFRLISFGKDVFTSYYHRNWVRGYTILAQRSF